MNSMSGNTPSKRPEVEKLLAKGLPVRQIAGALSVSTQFVYKVKKALAKEAAS